MGVLRKVAQLKRHNVRDCMYGRVRLKTYEMFLVFRRI